MSGLSDGAWAATAEEPAMLSAFAVATRYELESWRAAHACEAWSVPI